MRCRPWILNTVVVFFLALSNGASAFSIPQPQGAEEASRLAHIQLKATQGDEDAQYLLGLMYLSGRFVAQDRDLGMQWLTDAAELGHVKAQQTIADLAFEGSLIKRDISTAELWYSKLSQQGNKWANFRLGFIYAAGGQGVERNCGKAVDQFNAVGDMASLGNVAWILATCPEAQYRNGNKALELSLALLESNEQDPTNLDNLAAAYAEIGDFNAAISTQQKAIKALDLSADQSKTAEFKQRLKTYQNYEPYREVLPLIGN
ncbi:Sel1 domain protein repeat-containing protein [Shewanella halifaxensis HAW-EB4]|uniref:Sel1 domain protein repeat-containing protein n=1 Tax=Shewanella halifaxensis (strain HAW-EB4) TaxID=458817 RepID=B0TU32_SHEHH|nr:tetratricopeptide repeat protein [Shewanella halifaxensis]ABZ78143.1 Sel1 domain protein repeat-containing protein [Shewanella halifaxensis HAW-EB4]